MSQPPYNPSAPMGATPVYQQPMYVQRPQVQAPAPQPQTVVVQSGACQHVFDEQVPIWAWIVCLFTGWCCIPCFVRERVCLKCGMRI
ncbi:MAG: hypothetical protein MHM6MM_002830 [Cercozoa sp. M6MM]